MLEAITNAEGGGALGKCGRQMMTEIGGCVRRIDLLETAALSEGELVLSRAEINNVVVNYTLRAQGTTLGCAHSFEFLLDYRQKSIFGLLDCVINKYTPILCLR